jgi:ATP-dependent exoDNAse (exonuclease V) alpha subunit
MDIKNRDLGTVDRIDGTSMTVRMDGDKARTLTFDTSEMRHFDHGYAVTSHSSQGSPRIEFWQTWTSAAQPELMNTGLAYVTTGCPSETSPPREWPKRRGRDPSLR